MNFQLAKNYQDFRAEVREFCRVEQPHGIRKKLILGQEISREEHVLWHQILDKKGWAAPHWPEQWGGPGWDPIQLYIFEEELYRAPAILPEQHNIAQVGPVIFTFGTDEQKSRFLPKLRSLEYWFCQGSSEPGSGSDLASLKTRAVLAGDHYIVNGQKIWTTMGHMANWMFALVRTDSSKAKQKGISYLLIDLKTPGITIRPIITLDSAHSVNQFYFDDVRVPVENLIGEENRGWEYAKFHMGKARVNVARIGLSKERIERAKLLAKDVIVDGRSLIESDGFRQKLAAVETELKAIEITNLRILSDHMKEVRNKQDPKASILKIKGGDLQQATAEILLEVGGPLCMPSQTHYLDEGLGSAIGPEWCANIPPMYFKSRAYTIAGGTNEIQRNIIAKRILGL